MPTSEPVVILVFSEKNKQKWKVLFDNAEIATITKSKNYPFLVTFTNEQMWERQFFHIDDAVSELMREFYRRKRTNSVKRRIINPWDDLQNENKKE